MVRGRGFRFIGPVAWPAAALPALGSPTPLGPCLGSNAQYSWPLSRQNAKRQQDTAPGAGDVLLGEAREA